LSPSERKRNAHGRGYSQPKQISTTVSIDTNLMAYHEKQIPSGDVIHRVLFDVLEGRLAGHNMRGNGQVRIGVVGMQATD